MNTYTIGQLSKIIDLPTKTIRFYEAQKLISPAIRQENGYRAYSDTSIEELRVVKYARELGIPILEIKKLMHGCEAGGCHHSKEYLTQYLQEYLSLINQKIAEFNQLKTKLNHLKHHLNHTDPDCTGKKYCCNLFYQIINDLQNQKGGV